ncbi:MAG: hypothetical protein K6F30_02915 [Lachnospiraceae bacterium]|nr:hypothetical protein [Lachnospiraceae bacterium]
MSLKRFNFDEPESNLRRCEKCGKALPRRYIYDICEQCEHDAMYKDVKEYIMKNNVTELEVADHFHLPLETIQRWIKEGHLSYKKN